MCNTSDNIWSLLHLPGHPEVPLTRPALKKCKRGPSGRFRPPGQILSGAAQPTLQQRRANADTDRVLTYKISGDSDPKFGVQWFVRSANQACSRPKQSATTAAAARIQEREFFRLRVVEGWNRLPDDVKAAKTATGFSVADPDPGSGAFYPPDPGCFYPGSRIQPIFV
jgi:hypothetical protein